MTGETWTPKRLDMLRQLWAEGFTATDIGHKLGGLTKNQVIGKVHRLALPSRPSPIKAPRYPALRKPKRERRRPEQKAAKPKVTEPAPIVVEEAPVIATPRPVLCELPPSPMSSQIGTGCRWVEGDPKASWLYCNAIPVNESSWCAEHHARVFEIPTKEKLRAMRRELRAIAS